MHSCSFPIPIWIYSGWSVWYRLAIRPIVPNIEAIPEADRTYYEDFLLATTHNKTRVDFRWDVGFDLMDPERGWKAVKHMTDDLFPVMEKAVAHAESMLEACKDRECPCLCAGPVSTVCVAFCTGTGRSMRRRPGSPRCTRISEPPM